MTDNVLELRISELNDLLNKMPANPGSEEYYKIIAGYNSLLDAIRDAGSIAKEDSEKIRALISRCLKMLPREFIESEEVIKESK